MLTAIVITALLLGIWIGRLTRSPARGFLAGIDGSPPHWSVDHVAQRVSDAIARIEQGRDVEGAVRSARVRFVNHPFVAHDPDRPNEHGQPAAVYRGGMIVLQDGPHWERRLAWAICQHVRLRLHGTTGNGDEADFVQAGKAATEGFNGTVRRDQGRDGGQGARSPASAQLER